MRTFTLVPVGGLGNRIEAISTVFTYCQAKNIYLKVLWFKDHGLNCNFEQLFSLSPTIKNVEIRNAKYLDFICRDNPRKRNFWIPRFFEKRLYDACFYYYDKNLLINNEDPNIDDALDCYNNIFLVACGIYWKTSDMYQWLKPETHIENRIRKCIKELGPNVIGLHIRRTDNGNTTKYSPTYLYVEAIKQEITNDSTVRFFLASDSLDEKRQLLQLFGDKIVTSLVKTARNTQDGIIDAFVEMNILARTKKIYAGDSSFARIASNLNGVPFILLDLRNL